MSKNKIMYINHMRNDISTIGYSAETLYLIFKETYSEDYLKELQEEEIVKMNREILESIITTIGNLIDYPDMFNEFIDKYIDEIKGCETFSLYDREQKLFTMTFNSDLFKRRLLDMYSYFNELNTQMLLTEAKFCICEFK